MSESVSDGCEERKQSDYCSSGNGFSVDHASLGDLRANGYRLHGFCDGCGKRAIWTSTG